MKNLAKLITIAVSSLSLTALLPASAQMVNYANGNPGDWSDANTAIP